MDPQVMSVGIGVLAFVVSIIVTLVGVSWRLRGVIEKTVEEEVRKHLEAEHSKDRDGRTIRERIGLLEATCRERHG